MAALQQRDFELDDGRLLAGVLAEEGPADLLVFCHGTPSPPVAWPWFDELVAERGLRLLAWARPGYDRSTPQSGRIVASFIDDARAVIGSLGARRVLALGWSGGGPHALGLGAGAQPLADAVICVGSVAPFSAAGLDWSGGMGPENLEEFALAEAGGADFEAFLDDSLDSLGRLTAEGVVEGLGGLVGPADVAALGSEGMAAWMAEATRLAARGGRTGWEDDDLAFLRDWGFDPEEVWVPVSLWHGLEDLMVPPSHGRWLASRLPRVTTHLLEDEGHLSPMIHQLGAMLDEALSSIGGQ